MSRESGSLTLGRIAVAFATADSEPGALDTIAELAAGYEAEISYVFIEDVDLLRAAQLPFALEVCRATNIVRRINSGELERGLKERAAAARELAAQTAERSGTKWSFEVVRQRTAIAVLELAKVTDMTMFAAASASRNRGQIAANLAPPARRELSAGESIVVLVDRSAASGRAVQVAHKLAEVRSLPVYAVVVGATQAGLDRLTRQLERRSDFDAAHIQAMARPQFGEVTTAACARRPATVVLPISMVERSPDRVHALEEAIENPIVIVK